MKKRVKRPAKARTSHVKTLARELDVGELDDIYGAGRIADSGTKGGIIPKA